MLQTFSVSLNDSGQRIDRFVRKCLPNLSLPRIHSLFRKKEIKVFKKPVEKSYQLCEKDEVFVYGLKAEEMGTVYRSFDLLPNQDLPQNSHQVNPKIKSFTHSSEELMVHSKAFSEGFAQTSPSSHKAPFPLLYNDPDLCVIDKPTGWAVHPGTDVTAGKSIIELMLQYFPPTEGLFKPSLIHRLDLETSGILLMAKSGPALREWGRIMREDPLDKRYWALVAGKVLKSEGWLVNSLSKQKFGSQKEKMHVVDDSNTTDGKIAKTFFKVIEYKALGGLSCTLLELKIETGRTHQIRTQLSFMGHPVLGDRKYGNFADNQEFAKAFGLRRLFLHAFSLSAVWKEKKFYIASQLPSDLTQVLNRLNIKKPCPPHFAQSS